MPFPYIGCREADWPGFSWESPRYSRRHLETDQRPSYNQGRMLLENTTATADTLLMITISTGSRRLKVVEASKPKHRRSKQPEQTWASHVTLSCLAALLACWALHGYSSDPLLRPPGHLNLIFARRYILSRYYACCPHPVSLGQKELSLMLQRRPSLPESTLCHGTALATLAPSGEPWSLV